MATSAQDKTDANTQSDPYADDVRLARRMQSGEELAIEDFCERFTARVHALVSARLPDIRPQDQDDLTQTILIAAIRSIKSFRGASSLLTWVLSIARNHAADAVRNHTKRRSHEIVLSQIVDEQDNELELPDTTEANEPETAAILSESRRHVRSVLGKLRSDHQEILLLRYVEDLSVAEVAQILGLNKRNAEYRLTEARAAFKRLLVKEQINGTE
jgi:RNA polymerase sigma-70 factor, ECF subfamily